MASSSWADKVSDPKLLGEGERRFWNEIEPILRELIDELKTSQKIETVFTFSESERLVRTMKKLDEIGYAHNALIHIFEGEKFQEFLGRSSEFGITENKLIYMYIACAVTVEVLSTELFKVRLLFHMKNVDFSVSHFNSTLKDAAPNSWRRLAPFLDNDFRNALAHGTWAVIDKKIVLFKDAKLLPPSDSESEMTLDRFMLRIKNQNVLYQCLNYVLWQKIKSGLLLS